MDGFFYAASPAVRCKSSGLGLFFGHGTGSSSRPTAPQKKTTHSLRAFYSHQGRFVHPAPSDYCNNFCTFNTTRLPNTKPFSMSIFTTRPITTSIHYVNIALLLSFQCCGIVWKEEILCIPQLEYTIFSTGKSWWESISHPLILTGLIGQVLLLMHAFNRRWNRKINTLTVSLLCMLVLFLAFVGMLSKEFKMVAMQLPFLLCVLFYFKIAFKKTEN